MTLTHKRLLEVLSYNKETGVFSWAENRKKCTNGKAICGKPNSNGYLRVGIDGVRYGLHRIAWFYVHGELPKNDIDHINGIRDDNRISNLRCVTRSTNLENIRSAKGHNKSTGLLGAYVHKKRFTSRIQVRGKTIHLGMFDTKEDAHNAYISAKRAMHEGNTI